MESSKIGRRRGKEETVFQRKRRRQDHRTDDDDGSSSIHINNDVLEEIMVRLPVRSLIRYQILSKHWMHTIKSTSFKKRHLLLQKTHMLLGFSQRDFILKTYRYDWSPTSCLIEEGPDLHIKPQSRSSPTSLSNSCDGLVCIVDENILSTPIILTNPATRRTQVLPLSRLQQQYMDDKEKLLPKALPSPGLGKDSVTGVYKLVWLHNNKRTNTLSCEVIDFEVKEWRYVMYDKPFGVYAFEDGDTVFAKGCVYWLTEMSTILAYNLHTEIFRVITNDTISHASYLQSTKIISLGDRLWVTDTLETNGIGIQHFWRIKDPLKSVWVSEKMFYVDSRICSSWSPNYDFLLPSIILVATSKDDKQMLISKLRGS